MVNFRFRSSVPFAAGLLLMFFLPREALCAAGGLHELSVQLGPKLEVYWVIPFVCMLLSIAVGPLAAPHFWHHHFGKVAVFWGLAFLVPFAVVHGASLAFYEFLHAMLLEYMPFIILLFALFTVAGGIRLKGTLVGTPIVNLGLLFIGTVLASWMGTTGAAMLLIRPLLRANAHRRYKVHSVVFFIFLVANIGGSLTPLGDPPLFLGFLQGVDFFWTLTHMFLPMLAASVILLCVYFVLDTILYGKEGKPVPEASAASGERLGLEGLVNFPLLACVVGCVLMSGMWNPQVQITIFEVHLELQNLVRDALLLAIAGVSWVLTSKESRRLNDFNWAPIEEVAKLFLGIFISMIPALAILKAGTSGALSPVIEMVSSNGQPNNTMFFWLTGGLSSLLSNVPIYLVFFNTAGGLLGQPHVPVLLLPDRAPTPRAISAGAVLMGANQ